MARNSMNNCKGTKAGALLCPSCCIEYDEVMFDCEVDGIVLRDVKALRCPNCEVEIFSPDQQEIIRKRISTQ